ncbi:kinesin-related protein 3-like [Dreissena polymorpha]|uniref:Kinesin motor domain-containing protein n=1 Tax=Dreissena polymorpha TaxID=45954 RepID=A0A9D4QS86_DREPO|nr:kinesin-related protein 3-like [Dreissena polymorpha]XP_052278004.1 kinesin-related protein 3-like [Dreissena polymorpha]XP_052278005.1 kinesin-related protein 3-like [Dreissena polymorpha]XP_052278006.1 kinesin-related protein 3-like [Dreissena polymorpha]XP_052278007.1 kinesin-related protein 3-like [Dreissena polymorpha]KAH3840405.1 hypothetical protein DPMN_113853 [Dreissena polymorpha]
MGTLYECLKEAKLERYYPSFRSHGITKSEALTRLTVNDCSAFGINSAEDKRRLVELISIVKAVHNTERDNYLSGANANNRNVQSVKNNSPRKRNRSPAQTPLQVAGRSLAATNDVRVRERSNASASSHHLSPGALLDLLSDDNTESSGTDSGEDHSDYEPAVKHSVSASAVRELPRSVKKAPVETVRHGAGYNYGVPGGGSSATKVKAKPGSSRLNVDRIKVCVRKRPLSKRESRLGEEDMVRAASTTTLIVSEPKQAVDLTAYTLEHEFIFDEVFEESCSNEDVYIRAARPLVSCVFEGGSATCFAYGQTGAGKTHTMIGNREVPGLYLLAAHDIFSIIGTGQYGDGIKVWVSFFEIYCGQLFDLLNKRNRLHAREDGSHHVCIAGLTETEATDEQSLMQVLEYGNSVRSKGVSGVNPDSSRSHAVLQMEIRDSTDRRLGRISFIDLAGSERASDSGDTDRQTRMEGAEINQSLLALKECIRSIDQESRHKPFRQSKLTHILKDSFMGNSRTCMIANISPGSGSCEHTLNTLRYADRVKELRRSGQGGQAGLPPPPSSVRSSANVAMSNILMNIPASAPSIFQPSNILCSSTPMRQSTKQFTNQGSNSELNLDPSETPIRGPGARARKTATVAARNESRAVSSSVRGSSADSVSVSHLSATKPVIKTPMTRHFAPQVVSNVASNKQNQSSNSESDQTDTDSCNVTGPQRATAIANFQQMKNQDNNFTAKTDNSGRKIVSSSQYIPPVVKSSDTDNDFPTTDFNNEEELNDLNRTAGKGAVAASVPAFPIGISRGNGASGVSQQPTPNSGASNPSRAASKMSSVSASVPLLRKKIYSESSNQNHPDAEEQNGLKQAVGAASQGIVLNSESGLDTGSGRNLSTGGSSNSNQITRDASKGMALSSAKKKDIETISNAPQRPHLRIPSPMLDTLDDDRLFEPGSMDQRMWTPRTPIESAGTQPRFPQNPSLQPEIPAVLPAKSTELASFSQSPRFNLNKHQHTPAPVPVQQGFRPEPIRTVTRTTSDNHLPQTQTNNFKEKDVKQSESSPAEKSSHVIPKQSSNYFPSNNTKLKETGSQITSVQNPGNNKQEQSASARPSKGPISANWFDTPADHDTHIALSTKDRRLNSNVSDETSSLKSDKASVKSDRESLGLKAEGDEYLPIQRKNDRNNSAHSDSGIVSVASDSALDTYNRFTQPNQISKNVREKSKSSYHFSDFARPGYFSDSANRNEFSSEPNRVLHSPVTTRQTNNGSPVIREYISQSPVQNGEKSIKQDRGGTSQTNGAKVTPDIPSEGSSQGSNGAVKTEKLQTGACFSPIHPQPVTANKPAKSSAALSKDILHPTPQTAQAGEKRSVPQRSDSAESATMDLKSQLITSHEDQLAAVTSLCKQEMKLLLGAKAGNKSFNNYMEKVSEILSQKMAAIQLLQDQIIAYQLSTQDSQ